MNASKLSSTGSNTILHSRAWFAAVICGCALVGELKKGKYVYYHCTGHRGKCPEPYTREEALQDQFATSLRELVISPGVLRWLQEAVAESDLNERAARGRELKRMEEQHRRVQSKLDAMYE